jgi:hypothetical protein
MMTEGKRMQYVLVNGQEIDDFGDDEIDFYEEIKSLASSNKTVTLQFRNAGETITATCL